MLFKPVPIWKEAPFLRLIIPFISGIIVQWYFQPPISVIQIAFAFLIGLYILFQLTKRFVQFSLYWLNGVAINVLLFLIGTMLTYYRDVSHQQNSITNYYRNGDTTIVTLQEPLSEKEKSFKALSSVQYLANNTIVKPVDGSILLYFKKDSSLSRLNYGSQIIFTKPLQPIKNSGNPGCFDYQRYCAFQGIYYQAFLKPGEFVVLPQKNENTIKKFLLTAQEKTLSAFSKIYSG